VRRAIGPPGNQHFLQPNCAKCGLARFTTTDREIGPLCSRCERLHLKQERLTMARTMRANTKVDEDGHEIEESPETRGRPRKRPMVMSNISDATIEEFGNRALTAKLEAERKRDEAKSLDSQFRSVLKDAKAAGVDPDSIRWWLKARKMEPEDLNREIEWQNRMAFVMGLPMGTQLGVDFETGETVAAQVDEKTTRKRRGNGRAKQEKGEADPRASYILGYDAGMAGKSAKTEGRGLTGKAAIQFQEGWQQGMKDAAKEHGPDATVQ
jgi:hypothetical protein